MSPDIALGMVCVSTPSLRFCFINSRSAWERPQTKNILWLTFLIPLTGSPPLHLSSDTPAYPGICPLLSWELAQKSQMKTLVVMSSVTWNTDFTVVSVIFLRLPRTSVRKRGGSLTVEYSQINDHITACMIYRCAMSFYKRLVIWRTLARCKIMGWDAGTSLVWKMHISWWM